MRVIQGDKIKTKLGFKRIHLFVACLLLSGLLAKGQLLISAQTGTVQDAVTPFDPATGIGDQITVTINIDITDMEEPDNKLTSYIALLQWNTPVLSYVSYFSLPPTGYTCNVNGANTS